MTAKDNFFEKEAEISVFLNDKLVAYSRKKYEEILEALELKPEGHRQEVPTKYHFLFYNEQLARKLVLYNRYSIDDRIYVNTVLRVWAGDGYRQYLIDAVWLQQLINALYRAKYWHDKIKNINAVFENLSLHDRITHFKRLPGVYAKLSETDLLIQETAEGKIKVSEQKEDSNGFYKNRL